MTASLDDIMSVLQNIGPALADAAKAQTQNTPDFTSGVLSATTLVNAGWTRVNSVAVVAGAAGWLHDANAVAVISASTRTFPVPATVGLTVANMVFTKGVVFEPGAAMKATVFYGKV